MRALTLLALCSLTAAAQAVTEDEVRRDIDALVTETLQSSPSYNRWKKDFARNESVGPEASKAESTMKKACDEANAAQKVSENYYKASVLPATTTEQKLVQKYNANLRNAAAAAEIFRELHKEKQNAAAIYAEYANLRQKHADRLKKCTELVAAFHKYKGIKDPTVSAQNYFSEAIAKRPSKESPRPGYKAKFQTVWNDQFSSPKKFADLIRMALKDKPLPTINRAPAVIPVSPSTEDDVTSMEAPQLPAHTGSPYIQEYK